MEISLDLADSEISALRAYAIESGSSVHSIVATAVRQWMERRSELRRHLHRVLEEDSELLRVGESGSVCICHGCCGRLKGRPEIAANANQSPRRVDHLFTASGRFGRPKRSHAGKS